MSDAAKTVADAMVAGMAEIARRGYNIPLGARLGADRVDTITRYLADQGVDLAEQLSGDAVTDVAFLESVEIEAAATAGITMEHLAQILGAVIGLGWIVLGVRTGDGAQIVRGIATTAAAAGLIEDEYAMHTGDGSHETEIRRHLERDAAPPPSPPLPMEDPT